MAWCCAWKSKKALIVQVLDFSVRLRKEGRRKTEIGIEAVNPYVLNP
jgi:hypothetical protein